MKTLMHATRLLYSLTLALVVLLCCAGCHDDPTPKANPSDAGTDATDASTDERPWQTVLDDWPAALLSVNGTSAQNVWVAGANVGDRPTLLRWDGQSWHDIHVDAPDVNLWWVQPFDDGTAMAGGSNGAIFHVVDDRARRMKTPGLARHTVFGVWGTAPDDVYAVGGIGARSGFIWHYDGQDWSNLPLPADMPKLPNTATAGLFKVAGTGHGDVWVVGNRGTVLHRSGDGPFERVQIDTEDTLLTVVAQTDEALAVGGGGTGVIASLGSTTEVRSVSGVGQLQGIAFSEDGTHAVAVGALGATVERKNGTWGEPSLPVVNVQSLHAVWLAPDGSTWSVGGNVISSSLDLGALVYRGPAEIAAPSAPEVNPVEEPAECPQTSPGALETHSIARLWNEQNLAAIRLDTPNPGVHARNLYHLSLAMFDSWAAYTPEQAGIIVDEQQAPTEVPDARRKAISFAAYRILEHRYRRSNGKVRTYECIDQLMANLGYDPSIVEDDGDEPGAVGNRIATTIIDEFVDDGSLERSNYIDESYENLRPPLVVADPGTDTEQPTKWQPLLLARPVTQNGIPLDSSVQRYLGPHWGQVRPFAIQRPEDGQPYFPPGPFPDLGPEMDEWVLEVIRKTAHLDSTREATVDISPGSIGNNPLGSNSGDGHPANPQAGDEYASNVVSRADFGRVLAEFWADGPDSETPPGHWNVLANRVVDDPEFARRMGGNGVALDPLAWDVHMYLVLNGALHDAAVAAWEHKRLYESARPITLIRWMGQQGQSSDPTKSSYHQDGLPLVDGLIEVVSEESSRPGNRHVHLAAYVGEIAIHTWPGAPGNWHEDASPNRWMRAAEWIPYQPNTFVSPAFPGYISGHSTFSRAAARVLHGLTGSPYFPGGMDEFVAREGDFLEFEDGPTTDVRLQWATYYDAADQAGQSRLWGGIHIAPDDFDGRVVGDAVGEAALGWAAAHLENYER